VNDEPDNQSPPHAASVPPSDKIEITSDDLASAQVEERVSELQAAAVPQTFRAVGVPTPGSVSGRGSWWRSSIFTLGLAGLVGGLFGAILTEVITQPDANTHWYGENSEVGTVLFISIFAIGFGIVFSAWSGIETRSAEKFGRELLRAIPTVLGGAVVGGFLAQAVYTPLYRHVVENSFANSSNPQQALDEISNGLHMPRGLAFAIAGAAIGLGVGAARRAWRPVINGGIGGAVGGFLGGFLFDYIGRAIENGTISRIIAFSVMGLMIGLATGLVEMATKQHWIEIVSGGMAGKQFILFEPRVVVGTAPSCNITLIKDPTMAPQHLLLESRGKTLQASALESSFPILINGTPAVHQNLSDSDLIQIGSTILRYRSKEEAMPTLSSSIA
jgi:Inner membrane component of T3SS, cytoplasmic domain